MMPLVTVLVVSSGQSEELEANLGWVVALGQIAALAAASLAQKELAVSIAMVAEAILVELQALLEEQSDRVEASKAHLAV